MHLENLRIYVDSFLESQCIDLFFPALMKNFGRSEAFIDLMVFMLQKKWKNDVPRALVTQIPCILRVLGN